MYRDYSKRKKWYRILQGSVDYHQDLHKPFSLYYTSLLQLETLQ